MTNGPTLNQSTGPVSASRFVRSVMRILLAAYFLAAATAMFIDPAPRSVFDGLMPSSVGHAMSTFLIFGTALMIMLGVIVRPAALLLGLFVIATGLSDVMNATDFADPSQIWSDLALMGALLMIAVTEPGGSERFRALAEQSANQGMVLRKKTSLGGPKKRIEPQLTAPKLGAARFGAADDEEAENIFADLWDKQGRHFAA